MSKPYRQVPLDEFSDDSSDDGGGGGGGSDDFVNQSIRNQRVCVKIYMIYCHAITLSNLQCGIMRNESIVTMMILKKQLFIYF